MRRKRKIKVNSITGYEMSTSQGELVLNGLCVVMAVLLILVILSEGRIFDIQGKRSSYGNVIDTRPEMFFELH